MSKDAKSSTCRVAGCNKPAKQRGLCYACYAHRKAATVRGVAVRLAMLPSKRPRREPADGPSELHTDSEITRDDIKNAMTVDTARPNGKRQRNAATDTTAAAPAACPQGACPEGGAASEPSPAAPDGKRTACPQGVTDDGGEMIEKITSEAFAIATQVCTCLGIIRIDRPHSAIFINRHNHKTVELTDQGLVYELELRRKP